MSHNDDSVKVIDSQQPIQEQGSSSASSSSSVVIICSEPEHAAGDGDLEVDDHVEQPWLSTRTSRRRRYCATALGVRSSAKNEDDTSAQEVVSKELRDQRYHRRKKSRSRPLCQTRDINLSRSPSEFCRRNGFERPFNLLQIMSWIFFTVDVILGSIFITPCLAQTSMIVFIVFLILITISTVAITTLVTIRDPADYLIFTKNSAYKYSAEELAHCDLCGLIRAQSKHCRACNKCVGVFDHHCKWLNNCIGEVNYFWFLVLICLVGLISGLLLSFSIWSIVEVATDRARQRWLDRLHFYNVPLLYLVMSTLLLLNTPFLGLDLQLIALHAYLVPKGWTTYEYITQRVNVPPSTRENETFCCEWIIIDKKRLKRARERLNRHPHEEQAQLGERKLSKEAVQNNTATSTTKSGSAINKPPTYLPSNSASTANSLPITSQLVSDQQQQQQPDQPPSEGFGSESGEDEDAPVTITMLRLASSLVPDCDEVEKNGLESDHDNFFGLSDINDF